MTDEFALPQLGSIPLYLRLMKAVRFFAASSSARVPELARLQVTEILLRIAYDLFTWSRKIGAFGLLHWLAMRLLRLASRALGHVPTEFDGGLRADLPLQI